MRKSVAVWPFLSSSFLLWFNGLAPTSERLLFNGPPWLFIPFIQSRPKDSDILTRLVHEPTLRCYIDIEDFFSSRILLNLLPSHNFFWLVVEEAYLMTFVNAINRKVLKPLIQFNFFPLFSKYFRHFIRSDAVVVGCQIVVHHSCLHVTVKYKSSFAIG